MLLFNNTKQKTTEVAATLVISRRDDVIQSIRNELDIRNIANIQYHQVSIEAFDPAEVINDVKFLIFDVEDSRECVAFVEKLALLLSKQTVCIAIGNNDSILLAEQYNAAGIHYFCNHANQFARLGQTLSEPSSVIRPVKSSLKICVLACKGGVGSSTLSFHLATELVQQRNASLLLVQGTGGTQNMDLITKKDISNEVIKIQENLFVVFEQSEYRWNFQSGFYSDYDFTLFDHTLFNASSTDIEHLLSETNCVILVFNHELASIRNAKKFLEHHKHQKGSSAAVNKIVLCFNESQRPPAGAINKNEAANLIGQPVDIHIPYIKTSSNPVEPVSFTGKNKPILKALTDLTLGRKKMDSEKAKGKSLSGLLGKFKK